MQRCVAHAARRATRARRGLPRTPRRRSRACLCCEAPPPPPRPLPLRERRPCCSAAAAELLALRGELRAALPTADREQLARELEWLFEDAVEGWEALAARARAGAGAGADVRARLSAAELRALWLRRLPPHSVPMQYLTASADWRDMVIAVGEGVLVPRPETELLVDFALEASAAQGGALRSLPWADLGTGSGALAVALARGLPGGAAVGALDASPTALHWAAANAERLAPRGRVRCVRGSWERAAGEADVAAAGLGEACGVPSPSTAGAFAGVVSNPPYIPAARLPSLQAEVREYEPWLALDGDSDGQRVAADYPEDIPGVRVPFEAARLAARLLAPGGFLAMEVDGAAQSHALAEAMARRGALGEAVAFDSVEVRQDYAGVERFIVGLRS